MEVEVLETPEGAVVRLFGKAGVPEAAALEACLARLVAARPRWVTFDLSKLRSLSTLAMGVLMTYRRAAVRTGARVGLAPDLHPAVREALNRAELLCLFEVIGDRTSDGGRAPVADGRWKRYPSVAEVQRTHGVTWDELVELEPRLKTLLWWARMAAADCRTLADVPRIFSPVRDELAGLLGFAGKHHRHPILGNTGAYAVAYWKLYDAVAGLLPREAAGVRTAPERPRDGVASKRRAGESAAPQGNAEFDAGLGN
jgi:hypothetical protein